MRNKSLLTIFREGLTLAHSELHLVVILLFLSMTYYFAVSFSGVNFSSISSILTILFLIIHASFYLSLPQFILDKRKRTKAYGVILLQETVTNLKRIILPIILLFILGVVFFVVLLLLLVSYFVHFSGMPTIEAMSAYFSSFGFGFLFLLVISAIVTIYTFIPILFSVERMGLIGSLSRSFVLSFNSLRFVGILFLINFCEYSISYFLTGINPNAVWLVFINSLFTSYVSFVVLCIVIVYYQTFLKSSTV